MGGPPVSCFHQEESLEELHRDGVHRFYKGERLVVTGGRVSCDEGKIAGTILQVK